MMRDGVSVREVKQMAVAIQHLDQEAMGVSARLREGDEALGKLFGAWDKKVFDTGDKRLDQAGRDYQQMNPEQQRFVSQRLKHFVRENVRSNMEFGKKDLGKAAKRFVTQAKSDTFPQLHQKWNDIRDESAKVVRVVGTASGRNPSKMVDAAFGLNAKFERLDFLENTSAGIYGNQNLSQFDRADNKFMTEDYMAATSQVMDDVASGSPPVDSARRYHKAMKPDGGARTMLFASSLWGTCQSGNMVNDPRAVGPGVNEKIGRNVGIAVGTLAEHGQVSGCGPELHAISEALNASVMDYAEPDAQAKAKIHDEVLAEKRGLDEAEVRDASPTKAEAEEIAKRTKRLRQKRAMMINGLLETKGPFHADTAMVTRHAMSKIGLSDIDKVRGAYDAIQSKVDDELERTRDANKLDVKWENLHDGDDEDKGDGLLRGGRLSVVSAISDDQ